MNFTSVNAFVTTYSTVTVNIKTLNTFQYVLHSDIANNYAYHSRKTSGCWRALRKYKKSHLMQ